MPRKLPGSRGSQTGHLYVSPEGDKELYRVSIPYRGRYVVKRFRHLEDALIWRDAKLASMRK